MRNNSLSLCNLALSSPGTASFHTTTQKWEEFTVQDTDDFTERVIKEPEKLTIVDFHARYDVDFLQIVLL